MSDDDLSDVILLNGLLKASTDWHKEPMSMKEAVPVAAADILMVDIGGYGYLAFDDDVRMYGVKSCVKSYSIGTEGMKSIFLSRCRL